MVDSHGQLNNRSIGTYPALEFATQVGSRVTATKR